MFRTVMLASVSPLLIISAASAQTQTTDTDAVALEEIVVTTRKFEENLQSVPIAVSALTADDLAAKQIDDLTDVAERTVGFSFETFSGPLTQPSIRGQAQLRLTSPVQNVATLLDGVYLQRNYMIDSTLIDLQRIEIVKGPQSALYGRNAFAGAISLVTRDPSEELELDASVTVGSDERLDVKGGVSVPIVADKVGVLLSVAHSEFDGTWDNEHPLANAGLATQDKLGGYEKQSYLAKIVIRPIEGLRIDGLYVRTEREMESPANYAMSTSGNFNAFNTLNASPRPNLTPPFAVQNRLFTGAIPVLPVLGANEPRRPGLIIDPRAFAMRGPTEVVSAKVSYAFTDQIEATYQYGYTKASIIARGSPLRDPLSPVILALPPTFAPINLGTIFDSSGTDSSFSGNSHDARLTYTGDRIRGFIGVNYATTRDIESNANETAPTNSTQEPPPLPVVAPGQPFPTAFLTRSAFLQRKEEIFAVYGFISAEVIDGLTLTAEGRYTDEKQRAIDFWTRDPVNTTLQALNPPRYQRDNSFFTPRFSATWQWSDSNNVYASVARGVKSGGINGTVPFLAQQTYEDETNWTYELGSKNQFLDGRLRLNLAVFHTRWRDLQTNAVRLQANGTAPSFFAIVPTTIGNVGGVNIWGGEIEGAFQVTESLRLNAGIAYNNAKYTDGSFSQRFGASGNCDGTVCASVPGTPTAILPLAGNKLERTPRIDATAGFDYSHEFTDDLTGFVRGDVSYQSKTFVDEANLAWVKGRALVNGSLGVKYRDVSITVWAKNLFNKEYVSSALFLIGTNGALSASYVPFLGEQRTVGVTTSVKF
jgi:iron complex outermembrane receptor protein